VTRAHAQQWLPKIRQPAGAPTQAHRQDGGIAMPLVASRPSTIRTLTASALFGTASAFVLAGAAQAQPNVPAAAAASTPVEEVLITGSLIRGAPPVGVPVTALSDDDFKETGALTVADLLKSVPALDVQASNSAANGGGSIEKGQNVQIHGLGTGSGVETLMMVNGMRYPVQGHGTCLVDPSIIPQLAVDHIDVLADGASATYGSDAVAGVVNVILKHGYNGAVTSARLAQSPELGDTSWQFSQLYGTAWDSGSVTLTFETYVQRVARAAARDYYTTNFEPYGYQNGVPISSSLPGIVTTGAPALTAGAPAGFAANVGGRFCANCYSVPKGTGWNFGAQNPAPTVTWTQLLANKGANNVVNTWIFADAEPAMRRSAGVLTFDQDLIDNADVFGQQVSVAMFVEAFHSNRNAVQHYPPGHSPGRENLITNETVPTTNPYYPAGAPAGLRVNYNLGVEQLVRINAGEVANRYDGGFNLDLPYEWNGRLYYSMSEDQNYAHATGMVNRNNLRAALGNTVASLAANGTVPGQAAFIKPANIPFFNPFCDASQFQCNSPATLAYIGAYRLYDEKWKIGETGLNLDGPIFDLPGGTVRGAIGTNYVSHHFFFTEHSNFSTNSTAILINSAQFEKQLNWAVFGQINVPIVGEDNHIPLVQSLDIEAAYRYDHYNLFGGIKTPKIAATWTIGYGLSLRGTWGKSFRAPGFSEFSTFAGVMVPPINTLAGATANTVSLNCAAVPAIGAPAGATPGSLNAYLNPTCSTAPALVNPAGLGTSGGAGGALAIRGGRTLGPERAKNWAIGAAFQPTEGFLAGVNLDVTMYHVHIDDLIAGQGINSTNPNDPRNTVCTSPGLGCIFLVRANPNLPITDPANAAFFELATAQALGPRSQMDPLFFNSLQFIQDTAITNLGWREIEGFDFNARYDWDLGNWGAWNLGFSGNYQYKDKSQPVPGGDTEDVFEGNTGGRLRWRGRLGWSGMDGWIVNTFVNFRSHSEVDSRFDPPPCYWAAGFSAGSCYAGSPYFPQDGSVFPNRSPGVYTFDFNLAYNTGTNAVNPYLQNMRFDITVLNILDKRPPFRINLQTSGGFGRAFDTDYSDQQRFVSFTVTKVW
jgi:iron complex outermembrane receptor protein